MNKCWVYILESSLDGTRYVGSAEDPEKRLKEHNAGRSRYTKGRRPWRIVYKKVFISRSLAVKEERFLKSGVGRRISVL